jgi:hypothetical protein
MQFSSRGMQLKYVLYNCCKHEFLHFDLLVLSFFGLFVVHLHISSRNMQLITGSLLNFFFNAVVVYKLHLFVKKICGCSVYLGLHLSSRYMQLNPGLHVSRRNVQPDKSCTYLSCKFLQEACNSNMVSTFVVNMSFAVRLACPTYFFGLLCTCIFLQEICN